MKHVFSSLSVTDWRVLLSGVVIECDEERCSSESLTSTGRVRPTWGLPLTRLTLNPLGFHQCDSTREGSGTYSLSFSTNRHPLL